MTKKHKVQKRKNMGGFQLIKIARDHGRFYV